MILGASNLNADAYVIVQHRKNLTSGTWADLSLTSGVTTVKWEVPATNDLSFYRLKSSDIYPVPRFGYLFNPVADSFVSQGNPMLNYGANKTLSINASGSGSKRISYLKFVVDKVPASIEEVWLKVFASSEIDNEVQVRMVGDNAWNELDITWNNRPPSGDVIAKKTSLTKGWNTFDLFGYINQTGTFSFAILTEDSSEQFLMSKESVYDPVLEIRETSDEPLKPVGLFAGGTMYNGYSKNAADVKSSGFDTVLLCSTKVKTTGELFYNLSENELTKHGYYVGYPDWVRQLVDLKTAPTTVRRIEFSLGGWADSSFENIEALIASEGTGENTRLYQSFKILRNVLGADAINIDDESNYDVTSTVEFCKMLSSLGYKVTLCPYRNMSFWNTVYTELEAYQPGLIDRVYLQCYAGGSGNTPALWNTVFPGLKVIPGRQVTDETPSEMEATFSDWKADVAGGFIWSHDLILKSDYSIQNYANAVINGLD